MAMISMGLMSQAPCEAETDQEAMPMFNKMAALTQLHLPAPPQACSTR